MGHVFDTADTYTVSVRMRPEGTSKWYTASTTFEVTTPVYQVECWLDLDSVTDGVGSLADPFNSLATAGNYIRAEWVSGATNIHAIHVKRGTTATITAGFGLFDDLGMVRIDAYDTGANPLLTIGTDTQIARADSPASMHWISIDGNGAAVATTTNPLRAAHTPSTPNANGLNFLMLDCTMTDFPGSFYVSGNFAASSDRASGYGDFIAFKNCVFDIGRILVATQARYVYDDSIYNGVSGDNFKSRWLCAEHCYFRFKNTNPNGSEVAHRLHAISSVGLESGWATYDRIESEAECWIQPDDGNNINLTEINNLWISQCIFDLTSSFIRAVSLNVKSGAVVRNNVFRANNVSSVAVAIRNDATEDQSVTSMWVENNTVIALAALNSTTAFVMTMSQNSGAEYSGIRFNNNLGVAPNVITNSICLIRGTTPTQAASAVFTAMDGNYLYVGSGTPHWVKSFTDTGTSLAAWQSATSLDAASTSQVGGTDPLTDSEGATLDATLIPSAAPINTGIRIRAVWVDYRGYLRPSAGKSIGAYEYGNYDRPPVL
jgi:hypothetical protein